MVRLIALVLITATLLAGCVNAQKDLYSGFQLPQAIYCKGRAIIAVGPYAGTIDCQDGFMLQQQAPDAPGVAK